MLSLPRTESGQAGGTPMDESRFDTITRFLTAIQTRRGTVRQALTGLASLAFVAGANLTGAAKRNRRRKRRRRRRRNRCRGGQTRCFGSCTDTKSDPRNCGFCGKDCDDDEVCRNGECVEDSCPGGLTRCDGACVDTNTDPNNCGRCGRECDAGETCRDGVCGCDVCDDEDACPFQSVQAAVDAATAGDTLTICKGSFDGNVTVDKDLTLVGAGADDTKLEGENGGSVVTIADNVTATIRAVTISGGTGTLNDGFLEGGGVFNRGTLTLIDAAVTNNQAERGGGILNFDEVELTLDNTVVANNRAVSDQPGATFGGGILNLPGGHLIIRNGSAIMRNRAHNSAGIHNTGGVLEMFDSAVADNDADFDGAGIINDEGTVTLNNTAIRGNEAAAGRGGGILNLGFDLVIENGSQISENTAGTNGGGIFNEPVGDVTSSNSTIRDNEANQFGGGIFNNRGRVTLTQSEVSGNEAGESGGGAFNTGPVEALFPAILALQASIIRDNDAGDDGGGIFNTEEGIVTLDAQSAVVDNDPNDCVGTDAC